MYVCMHISLSLSLSLSIGYLSLSLSLSLYIYIYNIGSLSLSLSLSLPLSLCIYIYASAQVDQMLPVQLALKYLRSGTNTCKQGAGVSDPSMPRQVLRLLALLTDADVC